MRSLLGSLILVLVSSCLTGCWFGGDPSPTPATSTPVFTPPSSTPTPKWTDEEQGAIDAVQRYFDVWTEIGQNPGEANWDKIYDVANDIIAEDYKQTWQRWIDNDWHILGSPTFIPDWVTPGMINNEGHRHRVHGCLILEGSYLVDAQNSAVPMDERIERGTSNITVLHTPKGQYIVVRDEGENNPC